MNRLARLIAVIIGTLLIAAVLINLSNVAGRYLLDKPIYWAEEGMVYLQIALVIIGAALVTRDNAHLRMDAVEHLMPARLKRKIDLVTALLTVVVTLVASPSSSVGPERPGPGARACGACFFYLIKARGPACDPASRVRRRAARSPASPVPT